MNAVSELVRSTNRDATVARLWCWPMPTGYLNSMNMSLMNVSKETIQDFITKNDEEMDTDHDVPYQQNYTTPKVSADSLPEFSTWIQSHQF